YCLPLTAYVIGGALKPEPTLIFHSSSSVVSSSATMVPSSSAGSTTPPPVESTPAKFGEGSSLGPFPPPVVGSRTTTLDVSRPASAVLPPAKLLRTCAA